MKPALIASLICLSTAATPRHSVWAEDERDIRALIPAAAAIPRSDLEKLLNVNGLDPDKIENRTLTLVLGLGTTPRRDRDAQRQFRHLVARLSPLQLTRELGRLSGNRPNSVITMIHADRITEFTCEIDGESATGEVAFQAPELFAGRVEYVALKEDDRWRITEFLVPAYEIHLQREEDGTWADVESETER